MVYMEAEYQHQIIYDMALRCENIHLLGSYVHLWYYFSLQVHKPRDTSSFCQF